MKGYRKYFLNKLTWFLITFVCVFLLNFLLPRLMPGDPVAAIVSRLAQGMSNATGVQAIYQQYADLFGTNRPIYQQFFLYWWRPSAYRCKLALWPGSSPP